MHPSTTLHANSYETTTSSDEQVSHGSRFPRRFFAFAFFGGQRYIASMSSVDVQEILKLSVAERIGLVEAIWDSIADAPESLPVTAAQKRELDHRLAEYQKNPDDGRDWEEIRDSLDEANQPLWPQRAARE